MIRLVRVEIRRLFARRLTLALVAAALLGVYLAGVGLGVTSNRDLAGARRAAQTRYEDEVRRFTELRAQCLATLPPDQAKVKCPPEGAGVAPVETFYSDPRFSFHDNVRKLVTSGVVIGGLLALVLSASFIGAEWQAGTMAGLLAWEPRRQRVLVAKLGVAVVGSVLVAAVATASFVGVGALVALLRGTFASVTGHAAAAHFVANTWALAGRGMAMVALLAALGAGLGMLLRTTVGALGVVLGYLVVGEGVLGTLRGGEVRRHLLVTHLAALVNGRYDWSQESEGRAFAVSVVHTYHALSSGLIVAAVVVVVVLCAAVTLQRRDVT